MNAKFKPPPASRNGAATQWTPGDDAIAPAEPNGSEGRACCCPAKPAVRVIMPPTAARPRATELLLCAHHYRVSRRALEAARAIASTLPGTPADVAGWIDTTEAAEFAGR